MSPCHEGLSGTVAPLEYDARVRLPVIFLTSPQYSPAVISMYKKGSAVELQFSPSRLNDGAGDPFWIDLTRDEAQALLAALQTHLAGTGNDAVGTDQPLLFTLLDPAVPGNKGQGATTGSESDSANDGEASAATAPEFRQWVCVICGWIYDEATGYPEDGIAPGTRWEAVPEDWRCPLCDVGKEDFAMVQF